MSNEYKEWENECKEQAWIDIGRIADIIESEELNDFDKYEGIIYILEENGWI